MFISKLHHHNFLPKATQNKTEEKREGEQEQGKTHLARIDIRTIRVHIRVIPHEQRKRYPGAIRDRRARLAGDDDVRGRAVLASDSEAERLAHVRMWEKRERSGVSKGEGRR